VDEHERVRTMSDTAPKPPADRVADFEGSRISEPALPDLLASTGSSVAEPSPSQAKILERLSSLRERLATERFQLAVLGQFKRGKSTVLNALLGQSVLPIGVVPVTAIPTFLESGTALRIRVTYVSGEAEQFEPKGTEALREKLTTFVTEEANPRNVLNVTRVDVFLPAQLLERGVVLIDTPGVGSTKLKSPISRAFGKQ
jgi:ribosome biogenesis GTPase A